MGDPIADSHRVDSIDNERFSERIVNEYLKDKSHFSKYALRHYSQLETTFRPGQISVMLEKLKIPPDLKATIIGGYTGQFASVLKQVGMKVVFTDPLEDWVRNASKLGFESYQYTALGIPKSLLKETQLFASFECYEALAGADLITLRLLTAEYGILFGESRFTREEMKATGRVYGFKQSYRLFSEFYLVRREFATRGELRLYHIFLDQRTRKLAIFDCRVIKELYGLPILKGQAAIDIGFPEVETLARKLGINNTLPILWSLRRIYQFSHCRNKYDEFCILGQRFRFSLEVYEEIRTF